MKKNEIKTVTGEVINLSFAQKGVQQNTIPAAHATFPINGNISQSRLDWFMRTEQKQLRLKR